MPATNLIQSIEAVRKRARVLSIAYGVGVVVASIVGLLVAVVLIDYLLNLPPVPRVIVILGSLVTLGYLAYRFVIKPSLAALSLSDVAGRLEKAFPEFEDRLRSTVNFSEGQNPGSAVLQDRVIEQAARIAQQVDLNQAVVAKPAVLSLSSAIGSLLVLILIGAFALNPTVRSIIASRLFTPFSGKAWPKSTHIVMDSSVPSRVPVGQKIDLKMRLDKGDKASMKPILYYQVEGGPVQQQFMSRGQNGEYQSSLDARLEAAVASGTMKAWIKAGDDQYDINPITIVPRLAIRQITAQVTPPAYVPNRNPVTQDMAAAPVVTAEGSDLAVSIKFNKSLSSANPTLVPIGETKVPAVQWSRDGEQTAVARFRATEPARFRVTAVDVDNFTNTALEEYELIVRPDANLTIQIENPRRSDERTPEAFVPLQAVAEDDCGVDWVTLVVNRLQPNPQHWEIPLVKSAAAEQQVAWQQIDSTPERVRDRLNYQWELSPMKLKEGDVIEYQLMAQDNFNLDGRRHDAVGSSKLRITIVSQATMSQILTDATRAAKPQIQMVRQSQQRTKQETGTLAKDTQNKPNLDASDKQTAERLSQQESAAANSAKQIAGRMDETLKRMDENRSEAKELKQTVEDVKKTLERASEGPMKDATQQLTNSSEARKNQEERKGELDNAQKNQEKALNQLDQAMGKMENIGSLESAKNEVQAILTEQQKLRKENEETSKGNLGKKPEQMSEQDRKKLEETAKKQNDLAARTDKAIADMAKQSKEMEKSDPVASDAMKSAAQKGQDSKVSSSQKKAASDTKENKQAPAQTSQQQAELGLEQMLNQLKQAQANELAKLREHLAKIQEQLATLIRRQSGHNLDNLLLQGPDALKRIDTKVLADLTEASKRKPEEMKAPEPRQLNQGQELTMGNTTDLGRVADGDPETADIGARLTDAAGRMEKAIFSLRASKLPEAYDPSQVKALEILVEAKKVVDQQKQEADNKAEEQKKEAIRARYVKMKEAEEKLKAETARIEKTRDAEGNIPRIERPMMGKLPTDQQALAEETVKIGEDLKTLGSIIYDWANKDIGNSMGEVKEDLVASKTGVGTQAEQTRIIEQLDEMIKNLAEKPPEDEKFQKPGGGGGGGGGAKPPPPTMPTEAELQMLKSLQVAVEKNTKAVGAEPKKDEQKLLTLGNRQGALRNLLDQLVQQATKGQAKLPAEPENKDILPEETKGGRDTDVDPALLQGLAGPDAAQKKIDEIIANLGNRMARSRQRLALNNDPGAVTLDVQGHIIKNLDELIEEAKKNQPPPGGGGGGGKPKPGDGPPKPGEGQGEQPGNQGGNQKGQGKDAGKSSEGATGTNSAGAGTKAHDLKDIVDRTAQTMELAPRDRQAIIEGKDETPIEQYKKLIQDYYEALSAKGTKK